MILSTSVIPADVEQMIQFYRAHFHHIELVRCEVCGAYLALELSGGTDTMGMNPNELGKCIVTIGDNLLSSRVRLDENHLGQPMMGYQCGNVVDNPEYEVAMAAWRKAKQDAIDLAKEESKKIAGDVEPAIPAEPIIPKLKHCGNDTRISEAEVGMVPVGAMQTSLSPFEKHKIREQLRAERVVGDFKQQGAKKHYETFSVEKV